MIRLLNRLITTMKMLLNPSVSKGNNWNRSTSPHNHLTNNSPNCYPKPKCKSIQWSSKTFPYRNSWLSLINKSKTTNLATFNYSKSCPNSKKPLKNNLNKSSNSPICLKPKVQNDKNYKFKLTRSINNSIM